MSEAKTATSSLEAVAASPERKYSDVYHYFKKTWPERIFVLDGAMGTMLQRAKLTEADFRGNRFKDHHIDLKGNSDILCLTRPDIVERIYEEYFEAGADICETNTFTGTSLAQDDYQLGHLSYEINKVGTEIAKRVAKRITEKEPHKPRFVAGAIGPTTKTASISGKVEDPGYRAVTYEELVASYKEQVRGLMDGGADILMVETIFDTLNAKAALHAIEEYYEDTGALRVPLIISGTITDASGRTLSGQTTEAFYISVAHSEPFCIGLNCALGPKEMRPYLERLSRIAECYVHAYPNAGLPNAMGGYDLNPEGMHDFIADYAQSGFLNMAGGCCGTTPAHIAAMARAVAQHKPRLPRPV